VGSLMDFIDDTGGRYLNLLDEIEGWFWAIWFRDLGHQITIRRTDKGGDWTLNEVRNLLWHYGVATYGRKFDSQNMYIRVKKRQARWAEYVLLRAGVELHNPLYDKRNASYVARHAPGQMPRAWNGPVRRDNNILCSLIKEIQRNR